MEEAQADRPGGEVRKHFELRRVLRFLETGELPEPDFAKLTKKGKSSSKEQKKLDQYALWRLVERAFFAPAADPAALDQLTARRRERPHDSVETLLTKPLAQLAARTINRRRLHNDKDWTNLLKGFYVACNTEGFVNNFIQRRVDFCEACAAAVCAVVSARFNFAVPRRAGPDSFGQFLDNEAEALDRVICDNCFAFCADCVAKLLPGKLDRESQRKSQQTAIRKYADLRKKIAQRLEHLKFLAHKESQREVSAGEVALETKTRTDYLQSCLVKIEYKLIAENIRFVLGKNDKGVLVSLMVRGPCLYFSEEEIVKLNSYRENSLFRVLKCGFKSHNYYYTHNRFLENALAQRASLNDEITKAETISFSELKPSSVNQPGNQCICHHCKYVGRKSFFYICTHKQFDTKRSDPEQHLKNLFTFDGDTDTTCGRSYCSYCIRNFYNMEVRKDSFVCPFCQSRCYCPSCDYRDLYIRLFNQYLQLCGSKAELVKKSPIQRIVSSIQRWEQSIHAPPEASTGEDDDTTVRRGSIDFDRKDFDVPDNKKAQHFMYKKQEEEIKLRKLNLLALLKMRKSTVIKLEMFRLVTEREEKKKEKLLYELAD